MKWNHEHCFLINLPQDELYYQLKYSYFPLVDKCLTFMNFNTLKYTKLRRLSLHSDNLDKRYFVTVRNSLPYWITSLSSMLQFNKYFAHFVMIEFSFIKNQTHAGFNSGAVTVFNIHVASTYLIASINLAGVEVEIL